MLTLNHDNKHQVQIVSKELTGNYEDVLLLLVFYYILA